MRIKSLKTGTFPIIVHAPGFSLSKWRGSLSHHDELNPLWAPLLRLWERNRAEKSQPKDGRLLTVVTWNSTDEKTIAEKSLDRLGIPYIVLGRHIKEWKHRYKITLLNEVMGTIKTPYLMGFDSFDVLVLRDPEEAIAEFEKMSCEIVFNAEPHFWPDCGKNAQTGKGYIEQEWKAFEESVGERPWRFLNSGVWMGRTEYCKFYFSEAEKERERVLACLKDGRLPAYEKNQFQKIEDSDQVIFHSLFRRFYPKIKIDSRNRIFFNVVALPAWRGYMRLYRKPWEFSIEDAFEFLGMIRQRSINVYKKISFLVLGR